MKAIMGLMRILYSFDTTVTRAIATWPETWRSFFFFATHLGDPLVTIGIGIAIAGVGLWQGSMRLVFAGSSIWVTLAVGAILKLLFGRARPLTEYAANLRVDTFSFPSGHSSGSMIAYGLLAYLAWQLLPQPWGYVVAGICALIIIAVGVSRIYLGAHFPSDVIAGWALGLLALCIVILIIKPLT